MLICNRINMTSRGLLQPRQSDWKHPRVYVWMPGWLTTGLLACRYPIEEPGTANMGICSSAVSSVFLALISISTLNA